MNMILHKLLFEFMNTCLYLVIFSHLSWVRTQCVTLSPLNYSLWLSINIEITQSQKVSIPFLLLVSICDASRENEPSDMCIRSAWHCPLISKWILVLQNNGHYSFQIRQRGSFLELIYIAAFKRTMYKQTESKGGHIWAHWTVTHQ